MIVVVGSAVRCIIRVKDSLASCSVRGGGEGWEGGDKGEGGSIGRGPPWRRGVSTLTYDERQEVSLNSSGDEDRPMWAEAFFSPLPRAPLQL